VFWAVGLAVRRRPRVPTAGTKSTVGLRSITAERRTDRTPYQA